MSRHGYDIDCECETQEEIWAWIRHQGALKSALRGKRGQRFLRDLIAGLDALPEHKLIAGDVAVAGCYCLLGVVGHARGMSDEELGAFNRPSDAELEGEDLDRDEWDETISTEALGERLDITTSLALLAAEVNDDHGEFDETDERRWVRVRAWAVRGMNKGKR